MLVNESTNVGNTCVSELEPINVATDDETSKLI